MSSSAGSSRNMDGVVTLHVHVAFLYVPVVLRKLSLFNTLISNLNNLLIRLAIASLPSLLKIKFLVNL